MSLSTPGSSRESASNSSGFQRFVRSALLLVLAGCATGNDRNWETHSRRCKMDSKHKVVKLDPRNPFSNGCDEPLRGFHGEFILSGSSTLDTSGTLGESWGGPKKIKKIAVFDHEAGIVGCDLRSAVCEAKPDCLDKTRDEVRNEPLACADFDHCLVNPDEWDDDDLARTQQ